MTTEQIKALAEDSSMACTALKYLLQNPENVKKLDELSCMDVKYARFCERKGIPTSSNWRELTRQYDLENKELIKEGKEYRELKSKIAGLAGAISRIKI